MKYSSQRLKNQKYASYVSYNEKDQIRPNKCDLCVLDKNSKVPDYEAWPLPRGNAI